MERIITAAIIGITFVGGYVITSGPSSPSVVAQTGVKPTVTVAATEPVIKRSPAQTAYYDTCVRIGTRTRENKPNADFGKGNTPQKACGCAVEKIVAGGVSDKELVMLNRALKPMVESATAAQIGSADDRKAAKKEFLMASFTMMGQLGQKRSDVVLPVLKRSLSCPGMKPVGKGKKR